MLTFEELPTYPVLSTYFLNVSKYFLQFLVSHSEIEKTHRIHIHMMATFHRDDIMSSSFRRLQKIQKMCYVQSHINRTISSMIHPWSTEDMKGSPHEKFVLLICVRIVFFEKGFWHLLTFSDFFVTEVDQFVTLLRCCWFLLTFSLIEDVLPFGFSVAIHMMHMNDM